MRDAHAHRFPRRVCIVRSDMLARCYRRAIVGNTMLPEPHTRKRTRTNQKMMRPARMSRSYVHTRTHALRHNCLLGWLAMLLLPPYNDVYARRLQRVLFRTMRRTAPKDKHACIRVVVVCERSRDGEDTGRQRSCSTFFLGCCTK